MPHLIRVTSIMKMPLNSEAVACVMPIFSTGIADYTRACTRMLPVIRVGMVRKSFTWPLMQLRKTVIAALVPTPFHSPLLVVEFVLFLSRTFHIDRSVIHVVV